jgi:hypothetical protein
METINNKSKKTNSKIAIPLIIGFAISGLILYLFAGVFINKKSEFDVVNKENPKVIAMFDKELNSVLENYAHYEILPIKKLEKKLHTIIEIEEYQKEYKKSVENYNKRESNGCAGCLPTAKLHATEFVKTIATIESYARYGVTSTQTRNFIELKITFNDGTIANEVYTGNSCSGYLSPHLLMKIFLKDGKTVKVLTNGVEKNNSPNSIIDDLNTLAERSIGFDIQRNHDAYFPSQKTQKDFDKEWNDMK